MERALQADLVRADRIFPIASLAGSRDPGASPSAQCPAAEITQATELRQHRSADICWAVWLGVECAERLGDREARNRNPLAPREVFVCTGDGSQNLSVVVRSCPRTLGC